MAYYFTPNSFLDSNNFINAVFVFLLSGKQTPNIQIKTK